MTRSYFQKLATYNAYMKAHPEASNTAIYKHYEGTTNGMRKTDFLKAAKPIRESVEFVARNKNSDMRPYKQIQLGKLAYRYARTETNRGVREYRKSLSKPQKAKYDEVGIHGTVKDLEAQVYKNHPEKGVYIEFYPASQFFAPPVDSGLIQGRLNEIN